MAQVAAQHTSPIAHVLSAQRSVETIRMPCRLDVGCSRSFSQHLLNRIPGNQVDQEEDNRDHQPDHRQHVQNAMEDVAHQSWFLLLGFPSNTLGFPPAGNSPLDQTFPPAGDQSPACCMAVGICSFSIFTLATRWSSICTTVNRRPSNSTASPVRGIFCMRARTKPATVSNPPLRGSLMSNSVSRSRRLVEPSSTRTAASTRAGPTARLSNSS